MTLLVIKAERNDWNESDSEPAGKGKEIADIKRLSKSRERMRETVHSVERRADGTG